jgi:hypothetical protein
MKFARWTFLLAGIWGILVLLPQYFMESRIGADTPPAITHPEFFYGFIGVALAWQVAFIIISRDPARYRLLMLPSILEKLSFGGACIVLFATDRLGGQMLSAGLFDLVLGALFAVSWFTTADAS